MPYKRKVTYLLNLRQSISEEKLLNEIFEEVKSSKHKRITEHLNELYKTGDELYSIKKKNLPIVTFSAQFEPNNRKKEGIIFYNNLLVIDIDKLDNNKITDVQIKLNNDSYILAHWKSPSGAGIKGLIKLKFNDVGVNKENLDFHHKRAFKKLTEYFKETYQIELDKSGSDFTRLCFISWDKNLYVNMNSIEFEINENEYLEKSTSSKPIVNIVNEAKTSNKFLLHNSIGKNSPKNKKEMLRVIKFLEKNNYSITSSYDDWLRVAFAISNSFTFDLGKNYFLSLSKQDKFKFNELECLNLLEECYYNSKGVINFSSIIHLAKQKNYNYTNGEST